MSKPLTVRTVTVVVAASVLLALASIGTSACSTSSDASTDLPAIAATVHIVDGAFEPRVVEIEPGGTVMWINDDVTTHSILFLRANLRSGVIKPARSWVHTFDAAGTFRYYDEFRNTMKGSVVVRPTP